VTKAPDSQPAWILVRGDGSFTEGWTGGLPQEGILKSLNT